MVTVLALILVSALTGVAGSAVFIQTLIDDYIAPLTGQRASQVDFTGLLRCLISRYADASCLAGMRWPHYLYNRMYGQASRQSVLKDIRDEMFAHMQTLPIRYFDTHALRRYHELHYTNDTDTLAGDDLPRASRKAVVR